MTTELETLKIVNIGLKEQYDNMIKEKDQQLNKMEMLRAKLED